MTQTTNLGLYKPDTTDLVDVSVLNDNMDILDGDVKPDAVRYNTAQTLTSGQQAQARSNIDAVPTTRTINGYDLSANRTLTPNDINAFSLTGFTTIASNTDLNTLATYGNYYSTSSTVTNTLSNCPITGAGFVLRVYTAYGGSNRIQEIEAGSGQMWNRYSTDSGATWTAWIRRIPEQIDVGTITFTHATDNTSYLRRTGNVVQAYIRAKPDSAIANSGNLTSFVTLPSGYRPVATTIIRAENPAGDIRAYLQTGGAVNVYNYSGSSISTSTDLIFNCVFIRA